MSTGLPASPVVSNLHSRANTKIKMKTEKNGRNHDISEIEANGFCHLAKGFVKCGKGVVWYMRLTHTFDITHEARWVLYYTVEGNFQLILVKSATHSSNNSVTQRYQVFMLCSHPSLYTLCFPRKWRKQTIVSPLPSLYEALDFKNKIRKFEVIVSFCVLLFIFCSLNLNRAVTRNSGLPVQKNRICMVLYENAVSSRRHNRHLNLLYGFALGKLWAAWELSRILDFKTGRVENHLSGGVYNCVLIKVFDACIACAWLLLLHTIILRSLK